MGHRLISADSHVVEAPDLWERRMDAAYRDRAPHMKREEHGDFFYCEGQPPSNVGILGPAGHPPESVRRAEALRGQPQGRLGPGGAA